MAKRSKWWTRNVLPTVVATALTTGAGWMAKELWVQAGSWRAWIVFSGLIAVMFYLIFTGWVWYFERHSARDAEKAVANLSGPLGDREIHAERIWAFCEKLYMRNEELQAKGVTDAQTILRLQQDLNLALSNYEAIDGVLTDRTRELVRHEMKLEDIARAVAPTLGEALGDPLSPEIVAQRLDRVRDILNPPAVVGKLAKLFAIKKLGPPTPPTPDSESPPSQEPESKDRET